MDGVGAPLLWLRAALLTAVVLAAGVAAHVMADGRLPGPTGLILIALVTAAGCAVWLNQPASARRIVLLTVTGQTWVHGVLTASAGHRGDGVAMHHTVATHAPPPMPAPPSGASGGYYAVYDAARPQVADGGPALPAPVLHLLADMTSAHAPMMAAHLAASALVGLWLASGEQALWTLVAALAGATPVLALSTLPVPPRHLPRPRRPVRRLVARHLTTRCVVRRGPPTLLAG